MEYFKDCMTKEELKASFRQWAKKLHPDCNPDNPLAKEEFQEMQEQYNERLAELNGDYTKSRRGRERREREARERQERERREQGRRKVEMAVEQARLNRQKKHTELLAGDYVYARMVKEDSSMDDWGDLTADDLLNVVLKAGLKDECVVKIEHIFECADDSLLNARLSKLMDCMETCDVYGGWEVLQTADPANGIPKAKRVAKVVMFRSEHFCIFGNPKGDQMISDYYMPPLYDLMFSDQLHRIKVRMERDELERIRREEERKARLLAEQEPLIKEWGDRLIGMSRGLNLTEREKVAAENLKTMLKGKFPGVKFTLNRRPIAGYTIRWEDGPTEEEVYQVSRLFNVRESWGVANNGVTPWMERFGCMKFDTFEFADRRMGTLTKARILQQLGQVTEAFREGDYSDEVTVTDFDWMMLHLLVGININATEHESECVSTLHADGSRTVKIQVAVHYVFRHSSYSKAAKRATKGKKKAA